MAHQEAIPAVLAVDIASSGAAAALIDSSLKLVRINREPWCFSEDGKGSATLDPQRTLDSISQTISQTVEGGPPPEALVLSSMMHTLLIRADDGKPKTPIFTWLDSQGSDAVQKVCDALGADFLARTGIRLHPMFPVFKLAWLRSTAPELLKHGNRFGSVKSYVLENLLGECIEDTGTASAAGLLNLESGTWDLGVLQLLDLATWDMPRLVDPGEIIGQLPPPLADNLGLPHNLPIIAGSGDGFLANLGSGCEGFDRITITCGTTASVRKLLREPLVDLGAGTFCYRFDQNRYLLGCASNNGGNVLEWGRKTLGGIEVDFERSHPAPPLFIPLLRGERSPFWNSQVRAAWHEVEADHDVRDLRRAVVEGLTFHLALYVEEVDRISGHPSSMAVLSGNGFNMSSLGRLLAGLIPQRTLIPLEPGLATLRGAARLAFSAIGIETSSSTEKLLEEADLPGTINDERFRRRFERFKLAYWNAGNTTPEDL